MKPPGQVVDWSDTYTRYRPDVLAFLRHRLWGRHELAEDLTQETFARAVGAEVALRDPRRVRSYLLRIANNLLISHVRRRHPISAESDLGPEVDLQSQADSKAVDPLEAREAAELKETVGGLMARLPEDQRIAFQCGVIDRVPYAEIAREQGWSVGKVKISVFRARKALMAVLEDYR